MCPVELLAQDQDSGTHMIMFYITDNLSQNPVATGPHDLSGYLWFHSTSTNQAQTLQLWSQSIGLTMCCGKKQTPLAEEGGKRQDLFHRYTSVFIYYAFDYEHIQSRLNH